MSLRHHICISWHILLAMIPVVLLLTPGPLSVQAKNTLPNITVADPPYSLYIPLINNTTASLYGRVTEAGLPTADVEVELDLITETGIPTAIATGRTNAAGDYAFFNLPSLDPGQGYFVSSPARYGPSQSIRNVSAQVHYRLMFWSTRTVTDYIAGTSIHIGDFDVADIPIYWDYQHPNVTMPYTFRWIPRAASPTDSYEVHLWTIAPSLKFISPRLGYIDSYTLQSLPAGFTYGNTYVWELWVYAPDGGYGMAGYTPLVGFINPNSSPSLLP